MKLFAEVINGFQLLLSLLSKLLYTKAYSVPCQTSQIKLFAKMINGFQLQAICLYCLNVFIQMRIQNPVEHLSWGFLRK